MKLQQKDCGDRFYILPEPLDPDCRKDLQRLVKETSKPMTFDELARRWFDRTGYRLTAYVMNHDGMMKWRLFSDLAFVLEIEDTELSRFISERLAESKKPGRMDLQVLLRDIRLGFSDRVWFDATCSSRRRFELDIWFRVNIARIIAVPGNREEPEEAQPAVMYAAG
ncbi:MAG: hypothetical protein ACM3NH_03910 [Candidatus Saccharibacteria bacterium]